VRPAAKVNTADGFDGQRCDVIDVPLHEPFEPVADADDVEPFETGADRGRSDDTVDTGGRAAADEDCKTLMMFHRRRSYKLSTHLCR
jgi:hypothetical protein